MRGFLSGVFWGTVVAALGLGAASQLTTLPVSRIAADASAVARVKPAATEAVATPKPVVAAPEVVAPAAKPAVMPDEPAAGPAADAVDPPEGSEFAKPLPDADPVAPATDAAPVPNVAPAAPLTPPAADAGAQTAAPSLAPDTGLAAPKPLDPPQDSGDAVPELAVPEMAVDEATKIAPAPVALPQADAAPAATPEPAPPARAGQEDVLLNPIPEILPEGQPATDAPAEPSVQLTPDPVLVPQTKPEAAPEAKSTATLDPTPGLDGKVDGVTIGRLPRIGDAPPTPEGEAAPAAEVNPDGSPALVGDGEVELPPLRKYAREFENPDAKPLFSVILIDTGGADIDRAALAAMPFPVTFALDPLAASAAEASAIYRGAGQEVIMVATGIPPGATAADLEVTFQAHATALPEAVAVIDTEFGAFQADRPLATQVVPILKAQGRGLISWDRGLNAADQVARREGLPSGMVFRKLDGKGENKSAVRRALDRAAFKAAQDGRVMVIGQTLPETVAALMEWAVEGRAASVALAPVSAVLAVQ